MLPTENKPQSKTGPTKDLSQWIASQPLDTIPQEIRTRAKYLILDGVACGIVGAHLPWSEIAANTMFAMEGSGSCPVIGWGSEHRLSPVASAILNSTFIQGFELDDYHSHAPLHSNSLLLPALFSAYQVGKSTAEDFKATGADFLRSYIIGCEVGPRVGLAMHGADLLSRGWHSGAVQGPAATAAAASSLLGLSPEQVEDALGIACTQAGGLMSAQFGSMAKRMQHGFASRNGLFGALMARGGYTGINAVFETEYGGFLSCFSQGTELHPQYKPEEISSELGSRWEIERIRVKLHAAMAALHCTIDCAESLTKSYPELFKDLSKIERIETRHSKPVFEHGGWKSEVGTEMTSVAAQMSIQYAAALQFTDGQVLMEQFAADKLNRPDLLKLMHKVNPIYEPAFDKGDDRMKTVMTVTFTDGKTVEVILQAPKGVSPPASNADTQDKWRKLVKNVISEERMLKIEECVLALDEKENGISDLLDLLEPEVNKVLQA